MLRLLSTRAVQGALPALLPGFERATGAKVATDFSPTNALLARIKDGDRGDIAILTREGVDELAALGVLDATSTVDLVRSLVGLAVKAGAPKPDIATAEALKATLLAARSIAYSRLGASGVYFAGLIERLGDDRVVCASEPGAQSPKSRSALRGGAARANQAARLVAFL